MLKLSCDSAMQRQLIDAARQLVPCEPSASHFKRVLQDVRKEVTDRHCHSLYGLAAGQRFVARVRAANSMGLSAWSLPGSFKTPPDPATAPEALSIMDASPHSLYISWRAPAATAVHKYTVQYRAAMRGHPCTGSVKGSVSSDWLLGVEALVSELHVVSDSCSASHQCLSVCQSVESSPRQHFRSLPGSPEGSFGTSGHVDEYSLGAALCALRLSMHL
jgi:hypothetical protein